MARSKFLGSAVLALSAALALAPASAHAAEPPSSAREDAAARVAELNEAGAKHYAARQYRLAIEKFIEAYSIDHDSNLLFNIARCYEELGETTAAIEKYQAFSAAPGADADGRLRAQESLRALRQLPRERSPDGEAKGEKAQSAHSGEPLPTAEPAPSPRGFLPWAALGTGVLVTGLGATLYALGARDHDQVTSAPGYGDSSKVHPMTEREAASLVASGDTKKVVGGIGLGLGGALIATSVVLFVTGSGKGGTDAPARVGVSIEPGPGRLALGLTGSF